MSHDRPVIKNYLEFYLTTPMDRKRPFKDDFNNLMRDEQLNNEDKKIVTQANELLNSIKEQITPLSKRKNFENFPPFPDDETKRNEMMKELADIFKEIVKISQIEDVLKADPALESKLNMKKKDIIGGFCFAFLEHLYPKSDIPKIDYSIKDSEQQRALKQEQTEVIYRMLAIDNFFMKFTYNECYSNNNPSQAYHDVAVQDFISADSKGKNIREQEYKPVLGENYFNQLKQDAEIDTPQAKSIQEPQVQEKLNEFIKRKNEQQKTRNFSSITTSLSSMFSSRSNTNSIMTSQIAEQQTQMVSIVANINETNNPRESVNNLLNLCQDKSNGLRNTEKLIQLYQSQDPINALHDKLNDDFWLEIAKTSPEHKQIIYKAITSSNNTIPMIIDPNKRAKAYEASITPKKPTLGTRLKEAMKEVKDDVESKFRRGPR